MSNRTASMMEVIKAYALLRKTCLIHCATSEDRYRLEVMMDDWPDYAKEYVTITTTEETEWKEPKESPLAWFDEASEMTREQWEWLEHWRKSTFPK